MILRTLALASGLTGAAALSQFPEFGQQYTQRLGGAVSALAEVVADFDASAQAEGLSRADALASMVGTPFVERHRADMERTIDRYDHLRAQLDEWRAAGPVRRAAHAAKIDGPVARAAWAEFRPALPLTWAGAVFAAIGFVSGYGTIAVLGRVARRVSGSPART